MSVPHSVLAAGWVPFTIFLLLILLFSFIYIRLYQSKHEKEIFSTVMSMLGLAVALLTVALMPVDIFLVSFMKNSDGTFKDWAQSNYTRQTVVNDVLYAYYALYSLVTVFVFFLLPLAYFFYEEGGDNTNMGSRCCTSLKYTLVFVLAALLLYLIGAFVPFREGENLHKNSTDWEDYFKNIFHDLKGTQTDFKENHNIQLLLNVIEGWEDSISFTMSTLILFGFLNLTLYTGYGMSAWPMDLVKGRRSTHRELEDVQESQDDIQRQMEDIRSKYMNTTRRMSARDRRKLEDLENRLDVSSRRNRHLQAAQRSCMRKCGMLLRPFQIAFGIIFFLIAILVFISLLLTNIDKILHSHGPQTGYILPVRTLPNPIDITLVFAQKVFPLDYILMACIIMYFFFCSMAALKQIGIWLCCIRMYRIRPQRTVPQGLLFMCFILMFIVLALSVLVYQLAPQYAMFGSQKYIINKAGTNETEVVLCSINAPPADCVMTRLSMLTTRFCYKFWFFGTAFYYITWIFLGVIVIGFGVSVVRKRRSVIEGEVDPDDFTDSDEELLQP